MFFSTVPLLARPNPFIAFIKKIKDSPKLKGLKPSDRFKAQGKLWAAQKNKK